MKRFALAALILGSALACTKSNIQYEPTGEISLQPVTEKATKAAHTSTAYGEGAPAFNVWAWWADVKPEAVTDMNAYFASNDATPYISNGEFVHRGSGSWGGTTPYYWPTKGSLVFAGYSPSMTLGGTFGYDVKEGRFTVTDYVQSHYLDQTVDLMWFDRTDRFYNTNNNKNGEGQSVNGVPVVFHHALSWLEFRVVRKSGVPDNWLITELDLTGIETKADFDSEGTPHQWTGHEATSGVRVWSGSHIAREIGTGSSEDDVLESTPHGVVVIPQECADNAANLDVTYNLRKYDGTENSWLRAQTKTLPLDVGTDGRTWQPGKKYIYTIVFGNNEIKISPTVEEWKDGGNVEIEVQ